MSKRSSLAEEVEEPSVRAFANTVHLVTQSKGGVGKSLVAKFIAEYIAKDGRTPVCFDADPANQTFSRVSALSVKHVDLLVDGDIDRRRFDALVNKIATTEGPFVVDTGSSSFYAVWDYIVQNDTFGLFEEYGRKVIIHTPIAPPPDLDDTLTGFSDICALAPGKSVMVWLNERTEPIRINGDPFEKSTIAQENIGKLVAAVLIRYRHSCYHAPDLREMLKAGKTFEEMIFERDVAAKRRFRMIWSEIEDQLARIGI